MTESSDHIGNLLKHAFRAFEDELREGAAYLRDPYGVRPVHDAVLAYLDEEGTRASVLAERSHLTRQAITQLVDELEDLGVVTRRPDPTDGRAKIVAYTPEAREAFREARRVIAAIEDRWREQLGERRYAQLREGLAQLGERG